MPAYLEFGVLNGHTLLMLEQIMMHVRKKDRYSTLRGKTDKLEEAVNRELNVTRS